MKHNNKGRPDAMGCMYMIGLGFIVTIVLKGLVKHYSGDTYLGKYISLGVIKTFIIYVVLCIIITFFFRD